MDNLKGNVYRVS